MRAAGAAAAVLLVVVLAVTYTTPMLYAMNGLAVLATVNFVLFYGLRVRWEQSDTGRNMMALALALLTLTIVGLVRRVAGDGVELFATLSFALVTVAAAWTVATVRRVQAEGRPDVPSAAVDATPRARQ